MDSSERAAHALPEHEQRLLEEQVRLLYANTPAGMAGNAVVSLLLVLLLWDEHDRAWLLGWLALSFGLGAARLLLAWRYTRRPVGDRNLRFWARASTTLHFLTSSLWGAAGVLFFSTQPAVLAVLMVVLMGVVMAALNSIAFFLPAFLAHVFPTLLPITVRLFVEGGQLATSLAIGMLTFLLISIHFARNANHGLLASVRLRLEKERLAEALRNQKEIAEHASLAKTRFLAAASHDLRQPVQALAFFTDALAHEVKTPQAQALVANMRAAGHSLQTLLDALLDFSRVEAAAVSIAKCDFWVGDVLARIGFDFSQQARDKGLRLRVVHTSAWVYSDPVQLDRILRNLASNAIKYTPSGEVLIGCRRAGANLRIEVHDTGIGIPEELQKEVFREFHQLGNPERDRNKGLGLGLAITEGLARLLGHPLQLTSTPGLGSIFSITVPRGKPGAKLVSAAAAIPDDISGRWVLLIDDDPLVREAATAIIERFGCVVVVAESAREALSLMDSTGFRPEAILADYRLHDGATGVDAIAAIRARCDATVPAAVLTGDTAPDRLREIQASGFPIGHKPLSGAKLRALLTSLLQTPPETEAAPGSSASA